MTSITIPIEDESLKKLAKRASEYGISPEQLALATLEEMLGRQDDEYKRALEYVLKKNAELYRRLA